MPQQSNQFSLFETDVGRKTPNPHKARVVSKPHGSVIETAAETTTKVRLGTRAAAIPLQQKRQAAWAKLKDILKDLEGKDVFVSYCGGNSTHFWFDNLKLGKLSIENLSGGDKVPAVLVLRGGKRDTSVRIFTDQMVNVREQHYQGYILWLVDFWNGFGEYPLNPYRHKGYESLDIVRFNN